MNAFFHPDDTIAAIATPAGEGAIGIVRLSGREAIPIVSRLFYSPRGKNLSRVPSHTIHYGYIVDPETQEVVDEVLVSVMRGPATYTREDIVEINCHGGMVPLRMTLNLVLRQGARLAGPGEFTLRAFLNGRIDLSQAEAVVDVIRAKTDRSNRIAMQQLKGRLSELLTRVRETLTDVTAHIEAYIDFPEEDIEPATEQELIQAIQRAVETLKGLSNTYQEGRFFREGLSVAIAGRPNVGKSSLLNALLQKDRAIVTDIPGTTRDIIEEYLNLNGLPVRIIDTAGIRNSRDVVESEGVRRTLKTVREADLVLAVFDISTPLTDEDRQVMDEIRDVQAIVVLNKIDLPHVVSDNEFPPGIPIVKVSAKTEQGLDSLKKQIENTVLKESRAFEGVMVTNLRHKEAIDRAITSLTQAVSALRERMPLEIVAVELRDALESIGEITGEVTTDEILERIFTQFCIGK